MMCMYIETFHLSVIVSNAIMVVYGRLFGGIHPDERKRVYRRLW